MSPIYNYLEYRDFLSDYFNEQKQRHAFFSYRYFGNKTGLDASFLVKVLQKQMHLSAKSIPKIAAFLKFSEKESQFFELLISFNKAKKESDIRLYFEKLLSFDPSNIKTVFADKYTFFSQWYHIAVYELLTFLPAIDNDGDIVERIVKRLRPPVTVSEVKKTLALLERLELIHLKSDKTYAVSEKLLTTGQKWESAAITDFQRQMMQLSMESLERFPKKQRDISTVTLSLSQKNFEIMRQRVQTMRTELLKMSEMETNPDRVYQVNIQIFPLSE
ncbi:MAG: TIGR02147 family protein [Chitinivibrionales bacterium]|nr:TIGR02147 family protein [Chitinivibrionales bacterium]